MATQAVGHLTRIELTLDEYLHHVRKVLGCGINRGLREMERLLATGPLLLILREYDADGNQVGDAMEIGGREFSMNYNLRIDTNDHVRVVLRTSRPRTTIKYDSSDPSWPCVEQIIGPPPGLLGFTVVEQTTSPTPEAALAPPRKPVTSSKKTKPATASKEPKKTQSTRLISLMKDTDLEKSGLLPHEVRDKVRPRFRKKYPNRRVPSDRTIDRAYEKYKSSE